MFSLFSWEQIKFGSDSYTGGKGQIVNHLLILVKLRLFKDRKRETPPSLFEIKEQLKADKLEEKNIALSRNTITLHLKKWENILLD